jgi:hypothetical protein
MNVQPAPSRACWTCSEPATRGQNRTRHIEFYCDRHGSGSLELLSAPTPQLESWAECLRCGRMSNATDDRTVIIRVGVVAENASFCHCDEEPSRDEWLRILAP